MRKKMSLLFLFSFYEKMTKPAAISTFMQVFNLHSWTNFCSFFFLVFCVFSEKYDAVSFRFGKKSIPLASHSSLIMKEADCLCKTKSD